MQERTVTALVGMAGRYLGSTRPFEVAGPWWSHVEAVTGHLDRLLGVPTAVVRLVRADRAEIGRGGQVTYHVEALDRPGPGILDDAPVREWPQVLADHPLRAWWARPAGPRQLLGWAAREVGRPLVGKPVQVKTWNLSCVYRLDGTVWAKATAHFGGHEAASIRLARRHDASLAPEVLVDDPGGRRFLMRNAAGTDCWAADVEIMQDIVRRLVAVQAAIACDGAVGGNGAIAGDGAVAGVRVRRPASLLDDLPRLLRGEVRTHLDADELAAAGDLLRRLPELIAELESSRLPHTLVHGDVHPGNVLSDGTAPVLIDWAESHFGHPAFDIWTLLRWLPAEQRDAVEATWVDAWLSHLPGCDPKRALRPVAVLGLLLNAVLYQRFLDNIEPSERVYHEDDPASELRLALSA